MSDEINRYDLMMDAYTEVLSEAGVTHQTKPIPAQPTLSQMLANFRPMPEDCLQTEKEHIGNFSAGVTFHN